MSSDITITSELRALIEAVCDGAADDVQLRHLESLLMTDVDACNYYVDLLNLDAELQWLTGSQQQGDAAVKRLMDATPSPSYAPVVDEGDSLCAVASGYAVFSGWPAAYLIATVLFAIGLAVAAIVHVSSPASIVLPSHSGRGGEGHRDFPSSPTVARITGMVDCVWEGSGFRVQGSGTANEKSEIRNQKSLLCLGDQIALKSGLLEITYDTGARVILQGPVAYEVKSAAGGYLSSGKLTARLKKESEVRGQRSEIRGERSEAANQKSSIIDQQFSVRTPTAVITDLGTEFGVEVALDQSTQVHVIEGRVDIVQGSGRKNADHRVTLSAGKAVRVSPQRKGVEPVTFTPQSFPRTLDSPGAVDAGEIAYAEAVLADRPLAYWPLNEGSARSSFRDLSGHGFQGKAMHKVLCGPGGPFGSDTNAVTLDGDGYIDIGRHDEFALASDFTVEAWVRIDKMRPWGCVISAADQERFVGWGLGARRPDASDVPEAIITFVTWCVKSHDFKIPIAEVPADRWVHVAVVYDGGKSAHLYLNGQHRGSIAGDKPAKTGPVWVQIGCDIPAEKCWRGGLAHVAVYPRTLSKEQIQSHYRLRGQGGVVRVE